MKQGLFWVQGQKIPFIEDKVTLSTEVRIVKRIVIPARSVLRIHCNTDLPLKPACYLEKPDLKTVLAPSVCIVGAGEPFISFVNLSNSKITLFKNQKVGKLHEVDDRDRRYILMERVTMEISYKGRRQNTLQETFDFRNIWRTCIKVHV